MHRIDVVVPVRDAARFLPTFLASVDANSPEGCRYLVVDDASADETPRLLADAARTRPHLEVLRNDQPLGAAGARNVALERLDARWVTFVDVDDWSAPGHLAAMLERADELGADMVRTDHVRVVGHRRIPETAPAPRREAVFAAHEGIGGPGGQTLVDYPFLWAGVFDARLAARGLLTFDERLRTASDRPWFWRLHLAGTTCAVVPSPGYFYRRNAASGSLTENAGAATLDFLPAYEQVLDLADASGDAAHRVRAMYGACRIVAYHAGREERLPPGLRRAMYASAAHLLARGDDDTFAAALEHAPARARRLLVGLRRVGRRRTPGERGS
ncbi:glycosyltransferase [Cellulomonas sp.]|uniref:glycosyltransferase family 2 protein n=1 Tax=Cellulomonas sp. TaxID=40001 RepID=UPI00258E4F30|nr:glycosyltransferase [Cellulomonas sp.]MCR6690548.1 glycosyltransferase [Cellulomonas sp.]